MQKDYVLDANILLRDPGSIFGFEDNRVHITYATIMELSRKISMKGDPGYNAKEAMDNIDKLLITSRDPRTIPINEGAGTFCLHSPGVKAFGYDETLISEIREHPDFRETSGIILVTNKTALRIMASMNGLKAESYRNERTTSKFMHRGSAPERRKICTETGNWGISRA